jgi:hypothetical protein
VPAHRFSQTRERYLGCKHRFRLAVDDHSVLDRSEILMSGISATASVRRRFARKTDYVIFMVQFLLRRCGSRPGQAENDRQRESHSHETSDRAAGNKFQSASFHIQKGGPLLIAERPQIRLSSIHRDRETGLAILRAALCQRGDCQSA